MVVDHPLVSILIPVFNVADYLSQCLDSVLAQTYRQLQIVLVDDGSTDQSLALCQAYAQKDNRVEVYHQKNGGVASARNCLLSHIRGDFFLFIDSDDWLELDMVEYLVSFQQESSAEITTCGIAHDSIIPTSILSDNRIVLSQPEAVKLFLFHKIFRGSLWNKLFKYSILNQDRFNVQISYGEDALFCWHLLQKSYHVAFSNRPLYHYRMNENGISLGGFGPKKMSAHLVWSHICAETYSTWPQYFAIAQARHCIEDTLLVRDAAHSHYQNIEDIRKLQLTIRKLRFALNKVEITSIKMKLYTLIAAYSYHLAGKI